MESTISIDESPLGPMIGLRSLLATIRSRRRVWLITGLVGLIVGVMLPVVIPHKYTAETDLYLATPAGADPLQFMANNVSLLRTEVVAREAITKGDLHVTPQSLLSHYSGLSVSSNIMSIKFSGPNQKDVVSGARAVANAFLAVQARELRLQTSSIVLGLRSQISSLSTQINGLNTRINSLSGTAAGTESSGELSDLVSQRSEAESQLSQLQTQLQQAVLNEQSTVRASNVLDPAQLVATSSKKALLVDGISGLIAGLAIGLTAVILGALLSERPPERSTVSATPGRAGRVEPRTLSSPTPPPQESFGSEAEDAELGAADDRTPTARASRIGARISSGRGGSRGSRTRGTGGRRPGIRLVLRGSSGDSRRRGERSAPDLDSRPLLEVRDHGDVRASSWEGPIRASDRGPKGPDVDGQETTSRRCRCAFGPGDTRPRVRCRAPHSLGDGRRPGSLPARRHPHPMEVSREMLREAGISLRSVILLDSDPQDDSSGVLSSCDVRLTPTAGESTELPE